MDPRPGRFLLTGSARLLALQDIHDLLPGRSETIELWPLSQGEIGRTANGFVDAVFEHGATLITEESPLHREDYLERASRGGYPKAVRRADLGWRARFFESYVSDLISRGVRQVSEIERLADMLMVVDSGPAAHLAGMTVKRASVPPRQWARSWRTSESSLASSAGQRNQFAFTTTVIATITRLMLQTTAPSGT